jgi:tripartite-type tricarboxylate transporter receptor subunit TctC
MFKKLLIAALLLAPFVAHAQYPDRPIKFIVPYAAGGGADTTARIVAQQMSLSLGQQIIIENRGGAGGVLGADAVAKSLNDGYTLLFDASGFVANQALRKLPYEPNDLTPISLVVFAPNILVTSPNAPYKTIKEMKEFISKTPEKANYGSAGQGTAAHLAGETLIRLTGVNLTHIPYRGGGQVLQDIIGDRVSLYFGNTASTLGQVTSGAVKAIAIGSPKRSPLLPNVPTLLESGLKDFETQEWNGLFAPKGTPLAIIARLANEMKAVLTTLAVKERLEGLGLTPVGNSPEEFTKFLSEDLARVRLTVQERQIKVD